MADRELDLTRRYCPGCEPDVDPRDLVSVRRCDAHRPRVVGPVDARLGLAGYPQVSSGEADGRDCRAFAALLRAADVARRREQGKEP